MDDQKIPFLLFDLNGLEVYTRQTMSDYTNRIPPTELYWRDKASPLGYGPFVNITATVEHYKWYIATCKGHPGGQLTLAPVNKPIVRVDFRARKKVETDV